MAIDRDPPVWQRGVPLSPPLPLLPNVPDHCRRYAHQACDGPAHEEPEPTLLGEIRLARRAAKEAGGKADDLRRQLSNADAAIRETADSLAFLVSYIAQAIDFIDDIAENYREVIR